MSGQVVITRDVHAAVTNRAQTSISTLSRNGVMKGVGFAYHIES